MRLQRQRPKVLTVDKPPRQVGGLKLKIFKKQAEGIEKLKSAKHLVALDNATFTPFGHGLEKLMVPKKDRIDVTLPELTRVPRPFEALTLQVTNFT